MIKLIFTFLIFSFTFLAQAQNKKLHAKYLDALDKNDTKKASKILKKIGDESVSYYFLNMKTGELLAEKNLLDSSWRYYREANDIRSNSIIDKGDADYVKRNLDMSQTAIGHLDKLINASPDSAKYWTTRASFKIQTKDLEGALSDIAVAITLDSNHNDFYNYAVIASQLGREEIALENYIKAIEMKPDYDLAWLNRGFVNLKLKNYQEAIENLDEALKYVKNIRTQSYVLNNQGYAYLMLGKYAKSRECINLSIKINDLNSYAFRNLALLNIKTLQYDEACANIETSLKLGFTDQYGDEVLELKKRYCE